MRRTGLPTRVPSTIPSRITPASAPDRGPLPTVNPPMIVTWGRESCLCRSQSGIVMGRPTTSSVAWKWRRSYRRCEARKVVNGARYMSIVVSIPISRSVSLISVCLVAPCLAR